MSLPISIRAGRVPDAPINLANVPVLTNAYQIGLSWDDGASDGGSPIIDYMLNYKDEFSAVYFVYQNDITANAITVTSLTPGVTYSFFI